MKYTWTENDIICGRIVCKPTEKENFEPCGWSAKWTLKIGWLPGAEPKSNYCLVAMTDGMMCRTMSKAALAKKLNQDGMIPMPHKWFIQTMEYLRDCYEGH